VGEECHVTGSGFSLRDPCGGKCLELWTVQCPDGSAVQPAMCADNEGCAPGGCPAGQACYSFDDPFEEISYCVPLQACAVPPATADAVRAWELAAQQRAREQRERFGKLKRATEPAAAPSAN
jgi:hypothetical protein